MAKRPDVSTLASGFRSSNKLNDNFNDIKEAFDNTISRDGSGPNEMLADLDINGYRILNVPEPVDPLDLIRLIDVPNIEDIQNAGDFALEAEEARDEAIGARDAAVAATAFKLDIDFDNATSETYEAISDALTFSAGGTGPTPRPQQTKLREHVSPQDYGATGDGITDDTEAWVKALAAHPNIWVPLGTYLVDPNALLAQFENQSLTGVGEGSVLSLRAGDGTLFNSNGKTVHLSNLRFYGGDDGGKTGVVTPANDRNGLGLDYNKRSTLQGVTVHGFGNKGIFPINVTTDRAGNIYGSNLRVYSCWMGLQIGPIVGEYTRWSDVYAGGNRYGVRVSSGNVYMANLQLNDNGINYHLVGTSIPNDSHGTVVGGCFNHAATWNLHCEDVVYGHTFTGVAMIAGDIWLDDCDGVLITGGQVGANNIHFKDGGRNVITGLATPTYNNVTQHENDNSYIKLIGTDGSYPYTNMVEELGLARFQGGVDERIAHWGSSGLLDSYGFEWTMGGSDGVLRLYGNNNNVRTFRPAIAFDRDTGSVKTFKWGGQSAADDAAAAALTPAVPVGELYYNSTVGALRPRQT